MHWDRIQVLGASPVKAFVQTLFCQQVRMSVHTVRHGRPGVLHVGGGRPPPTPRSVAHGRLSPAFRPDHDGPHRGRSLPPADGRIPGGGPELEFLGGSAANVAVAAARLGRAAAVISRTGDDPFGAYLHRALAEFGVDDRWVTPVGAYPTPVTFCELFPPDDYPGGRPTTYHLSAGTARSGPYSVHVTPESAGWGYSALRVLPLPPGGSHTFGTGDSEWIVLPLAGSCTATVDGTAFRLTGRRDVFSGVSDFCVRAEGRPGHRRLPRRRPVRAHRRPLRPATARPLRPGLRGPGGAARHRQLLPPGQQLRRGRRLRVRQPHRRGGAHPGRQLVVLPAAQARRAPARRGVGAGGDLLLRVHRPRRHPRPRLPAGLPLRAGPGHGPAGRGARRRRRTDPRRLARAVDGRARPPHVLPQRHGRTRRGPGLADPRPPRPRLGPRHLAGPASGRPPLPDTAPERSA
ncbi:hypothetical protein SFUMM280S_07071 [Streptomyces fumanus]